MSNVNPHRRAARKARKDARGYALRNNGAPDASQLPAARHRRNRLEAQRRLAERFGE